IKSGCPRNDCLVNPQGVQEIKDRIGISGDQKVLLFAPTLRKSQEVVKAGVDIAGTLEHLKKRDERDWICLVRAHPKSVGIEMTSGGNVIDVSKYPDMADLLMITDCLITDYSSSAGDFILTKKPLILAQFDLEQYKSQDRDFYVDVNSIGFLIAKSQEELNGYLDRLSDEEFAENSQRVMEYFGTHETGHAAEDVCRLIDSKYRAWYGDK
ncbi:MAG: CDP-glycerol glycerophosphotransferase family protein, partial [Lachnospiraceae bacterium]|nr:CDP-glycerol glycerophosphotransferase family protein [Lachnospiraceae bacterium]